MTSLFQVSKQLSYILRHKPESIGAKLDEEGWLPTATLLDKTGIDMPTLEKVVADNNKKRFEFNNDQSKIRARQGHSVQVELGYKPVTPPAVLYHGTIVAPCRAIFKEGLTKQARHHVHLSEDRTTAHKVGDRRGVPVILYVDAKRMYENGHEFFVTPNNVWLTDSVPPEYISTRVKFIRNDDGKEFFEVLQSHWSDIMSRDGERDRVKWYGGDGYVGATTYKKVGE